MKEKVMNFENSSGENIEQNIEQKQQFEQARFLRFAMSIREQFADNLTPLVDKEGNEVKDAVYLEHLSKEDATKLEEMVYSTFFKPYATESVGYKRDIGRLDRRPHDELGKLYDALRPQCFIGPRHISKVLITRLESHPKKSGMAKPGVSLR